MENHIFMSNSLGSKDHEGFLHVALESEIVWGNIENVLIRESFEAIMESDKQLLIESKESAFKRFIGFFKKLWETFKKAMGNLLAKLKLRKKVADDLVKQANAIDYAAAGQLVLPHYTEYRKEDVAYAAALADKILNNTTGDVKTREDLIKKATGYDSAEVMVSNIESRFEKRQNVKMEKNIIIDCIQILKSQYGVPVLQKLSSTMNKATNMGQKQAQLALGHSASDTNQVALIKTNISMIQAAASYISSLVNNCAKHVNGAFSQAVNVVRKAVGAKKSAK